MRPEPRKGALAEAQPDPRRTDTCGLAKGGPCARARLGADDNPKRFTGLWGPSDVIRVSRTGAKMSKGREHHLHK